MLSYLHIPFCDSKCPYCGFNSYTNISDLQDTYMQSIVQQLNYKIKKQGIEKNSLESLFIGGGTPSCLDANSYKKFFTLIKPYLQSDAEITIEANPNSASPAWLKQMKDLGINRISFGVQSFQKEKLKFLGRNHTPKEAMNAVENAHKLGIQNISLDLMYGTKLDDKKSLQKDIETAFSLPINHMSAYALTLEENTPFEKKESYSNPSSRLSRFVIEGISQKFQQYEISNFGQYQSLHNIGYWEGKEYLGIGAGAVGFYKDYRYYPHKDVKSYIQDPLHVDKETLSKEALCLEKIFLGLRSKVGVDFDILDRKQQSKAKILIDEKKLIFKKRRLFNRDFLLADEIALFLLTSSS